jgi:hypothetical protein
VKVVHNLGKVEFHPLDLAMKIQPHFSKLSKLSGKSTSPILKTAVSIIHHKKSQIFKRFNVTKSVHNDQKDVHFY